MNGKTTIDETMNPCSAAMDRQTYGCRWINVTLYGRRLARIGFLGVYLDFFLGGVGFLYARMNGGRKIFFPGGSLSWPMPRT